MSTTPISWSALVALARAGTPERFVARGRSVLGDGRHRERDTFTVVHDAERWRIDQQLEPVRVIGDAVRDLVSEGGGVRRVPAPQGWSGLPAVALVRPGLEQMDDLSMFGVRSGPHADLWAGRPCWRVELAYEDKDPFTVRIDAETGLRLSQESVEGSVVLDELDVEAEARIPHDTFALLSLTPDVDLELTVPTPSTLVRLVARVQSGSPPGVRVAVRAFDDLADSCTLVMRSDGDVVAFLDRRSDEHATPYEALLPGRQERWGWEPWSYSFDARADDAETRRWARRLLEQVVRADPRPDDPVF